jgi:hypothetical protein
VVDQLLEDLRLPVDTVDRLLVPVVQQAQVRPEEVPRQQRQYFGLFEHGEEQIKIEHFLEFALLEEAIEYAGSFSLDHLDDLEGKFVLSVVGVGWLGGHGQVADGLRDQPGVIRDVVQQLGVVRF